MGLGKIPDNIQKIDRDDALVTWLDTTPIGSTRTWALLGIRSYGISESILVHKQKQKNG